MMKWWLEKKVYKGTKRIIKENLLLMRTLNDFSSKNVYIDKSDDIVNKYNNTYHSTIKIKPVDAK